jgi:hypothetical protein
MERAQEGVFHPDKRRAPPCGNALAAPGGRAVAPDEDAVFRAGQAEAKLAAGKLQDAVKPPVAEEREVLVV